MEVRDYRRIQIFTVAAGVAAFSVSLLGGAMRNRMLAQLGAWGFLAALAGVIVVGFLAWRRG